ncbi:GNAT family N-acetyltransferase [Mucilaginibacter sp. PPCGB 2223]|uniref:GNAT family N-acetyltransferase n=1 Tax=Mucilaginibacter sp. PPCGB 2223 TaxID=1886027 RepID=UPI0008248CA2|nr:GNAT family protein [Mucilaginibacter sp. PPCGB 2223]OCX53316.1 GNAT family N-acetyltransferase [Mucilaginibacter sp. PPCGB 2223]
MRATFNPAEKYILEDDRVLLRPLEAGDIKYLMPFSLNEPDIWTYSSITGAGRENMENYVKGALAARDTGTEYPFIVFDKKANAYAGLTRFYDIQLNNKTLQLGYTWYGKQFQGTGMNRHCKYLLLGFAFEELGMERVEFRADNANSRSIAAMKAIGCTVEGVLRSNGIKRDGTRRDSIVLSILKQEWESGVKEVLKAKLI